MSHSGTYEGFSDVKYAYVLHGDVRPDLGDLQEYAEELTYPNHQRTRVKPDTHEQLLLADVYLDLSRAADTPELYVEQAAAALHRVADSQPRFNRDLRPNVKAIFKLSDLPLWLSPDQPHSKINEYEGRLGAVETVMASFKEKKYTQHDLSHIYAEMVPIILGARDDSGRYGRFALLREEAREAGKGALGENWDIALTDEAPLLLDNPELRVQVKLNDFSGKQKLRTYGVAALAAARCGFGKPLDVLRECVDEAYGKHSPKLDEISEAIDEKLTSELVQIAALGGSTPDQF